MLHDSMISYYSAAYFHGTLISLPRRRAWHITTPLGLTVLLEGSKAADEGYNARRSCCTRSVETLSWLNLAINTRDKPQQY